MIQQPLPFQEFKIPALICQLLRLANGADYEHKYYFYDFKRRFLVRHAVPDGVDLQIITYRCWCGDGIFRGRDHDAPERYWDVCFKCNGTGVYRVRKIILVRWIIGDQLFHIPSRRDVDLVDAAEFKNTLIGVLRHGKVSARMGQLAMILLLLFYDRTTLRNWWRRYLYDRCVRARWKIRSKIWHLQIRLGWRDDIPF